ncbi:MAG: MBL fold metallo-hydrolase [Betaproteobacteria bacterium]|nr:MBL fold metallo-hydrolase [Betaproteobacteria bacterium]
MRSSAHPSNSSPSPIRHSAPLEYPFAGAPEPGSTVEVAPGVHWLRMPLPFALDHINLWLLEEDDGWTIVDCGLSDARTLVLWEQIFAKRLGAKPVRRVLVTHCHPDHAGNAAWLCQRFGVDLWMSQGEYLTAHALRHEIGGYGSAASLAHFARYGADGAHRSALQRRGNAYVVHVPDFPRSYRRLVEGDSLKAGPRRWRVIVGLGHAPEHVSLYCEELAVLISGDMLLPKISTNVSVWSIEPEGDPLGLFLSSIGRYRSLPADVLVLPSHGLPFRGAHERIAQLEAHHAARLAELETALGAGARSAMEVVETLFPRKLDVHQMFFALGETIAHLNRLEHAGLAVRRLGDDGVFRFSLRSPV